MIISLIVCWKISRLWVVIRSFSKNERFTVLEEFLIMCSRTSVLLSVISFTCIQVFRAMHIGCYALNFVLFVFKVQRTMLELLNQLDGFSSHHDIKVLIIFRIA